MKQQRGFFLIEVMIALLIFTLGVLGMVGMGSISVAAQSDSRFRTDAANLANDIAAHIQLDVDRSSGLAMQNSLNSFQHRPAGGNCNFGGAVSPNAGVTAWLAKVGGVGPGLTGLPGVNATTQQILVNTSAAAFNRVQITLCWRAPNDTAFRSHTLVTWVNPELF